MILIAEDEKNIYTSQQFAGVPLKKRVFSHIDIKDQQKSTCSYDRIQSDVVNLPGLTQA